MILVLQCWTSWKECVRFWIWFWHLCPSWCRCIYLWRRNIIDRKSRGQTRKTKVIMGIIREVFILCSRSNQTIVDRPSAIDQRLGIIDQKFNSFIIWFWKNPDYCFCHFTLDSTMFKTSNLNDASNSLIDFGKHLKLLINKFGDKII